MRRFKGAIVLAAAFSLAAAAAWAQIEEDAGQGSSLSRPMKNAIRFYEKGDDIQAMDRFMEILTKGDPAERSMANEYINLISHRMSSGETDFKKPAPPVNATRVEEVAAPRRLPEAPAAVRQAGPEVVIEPGGESLAAAGRPGMTMPSAPMAPRAPQAPTRSDGPLPPANKALMQKEIKAKIRNNVERALKELRAIEEVRVVMMENGDPRAIGIPSPLLFSSGIAFQKGAVKLLDALTRMAYGLGSTQVIILPEGTAIGDAKVLDMRRTMGISAHLFSAGIAPPRVKVNLLSTQVELPKGLQDFKGIVVLFLYHQPLGLVVESSLGEESGPPLSLGVYPTAFRPDRNEGVVIEFSVSDPPAGLVSWKFQLLQPSPSAGGDLAPLQEVLGGGPVFHQIYWNGRQNYFGPLLPAGRYECLLTATDTKNRQRTEHRWIQLLDEGQSASVTPGSGSSPVSAAPPTPAAAAVAPSGAKGVTIGKGAAPPADLQDATAKPESLIKESKGVQIGKGKKRKGSAKAKPQAAAEPEEAAPAVARVSAAAAPAAPAGKPAGNYEIAFNKDSHQMTPEGEKTLAKVAETVVYYPLENLKLVGFAQSAEPGAAALAERRAQMVAGLLINKYQVEPKKIQVKSSVAQTPSYKVEVYFVGND